MKRLEIIGEKKESEEILLTRQKEGCDNFNSAFRPQSSEIRTNTTTQKSLSCSLDVRILTSELRKKKLMVKYVQSVVHAWRLEICLI